MTTFFVTTMGVEPIRLVGTTPSRWRVYQFLHVANGSKIKKVKHKRTLNFFCDPAGIRTQDPIIKSDVLYQLSYRVSAFRKK